MQQQPDWFEYLKLAPDAPAEQLEQAVERLSRQAAALAVTAPERSQQLRDTVRSIKRDLLSGAENRARYDAARAAVPEAFGKPPAAPPTVPPAMAPPGAGAPPLPPTAPWSAMPQPPAPGPFNPGPVAGGPGYGGQGGGQGAGGQSQALGGLEALGSRVARFLRTGWTCSACGKEAMPSDKFCTKCGTAITPTRHDAPARPTPRATCANCNMALGANDAFCARCGTSVEK
jgi:hypothetical protein